MAEPSYQSDLTEQDKKKKREEEKIREIAEKRATATKVAPSIVSYKPSSVAGLLDCTERHVQKLIKQGELKAYSIGRRGSRVTLESIEGYIDRQTRK